MRNKLLLITISIVLFLSCNKNIEKGNSISENAKSKSPEVPLNLYKNNTPNENVVNSFYGCGSYLSGTYSGIGYYKYPDYNLDFSNTTSQSTIRVIVNSYDIPNRFTIKDFNGNVVASTSWMGYVNYPGPWGASLNTPQTNTLIFTKNVINSFVLIVETSTNNYSDSWYASISCTPKDTIAVIKNSNNPYDYAGLQHNNGVTYVVNRVNTNSPTAEADILHYTKIYGSTIGLDTTGFDSWYNYASAQGYFYLYDTIYDVYPNPLNTKLYNDGKISSKARSYLNSINNKIDNVITDNALPSSTSYSKIANQLIVVENNIKNDGTLTTNERNGLLRVAAINRYTGAYWANYINNNGGGGSMQLFRNWSWRRFWHADGVGAIGGAAGGALGGWLGALWGAVLGAVGGSAGYVIFGD